jgi:hypothetical protein
MIQRAFSVVCVLFAWGTTAFGQDLPDVTPPKDVQYGSCMRNTSEKCPPEPPNCGTIACPPRQVRMITDPDDFCGQIPEFEFNCPDNSKEPCAWTEGPIPNCEDAEDPRPSSGYDAFRQLPDVICWKVRACSRSCTQTTIVDKKEKVMSIRNPSEKDNPLCTVFMPREIFIYKHKCNSGPGNGDPDFESEWHRESAFKCDGKILPCVPNDPPNPPNPGPGKPELVPDIDDPIGQK